MEQATEKKLTFLLGFGLCAITIFLLIKHGLAS